VIIEDTRITDLLQYPDYAENEGMRSIVSLPLKLHGKIIGALRIYHSEPWAATARELGYLQVLTKTLALALKSFRLSSAIMGTRESLEEIHPIWL
jgi:transcriptional regulator with GAF, ATPase, and Fis domain